MPQRITIKEAEAIRRSLDLDVYQFSTRIGLSPTAYFKALQRGNIGAYMSFRIMMHCRHQLSMVRG